MPNSQNIKHFRVNPVEVTILGLMALILCNSVYRLFEERSDFKFAALSPMTAQPTQSAHRSPASVIPDFANVDMTCDSAKDVGPEQRTTAGKVRLTGPLCFQNSPGTDPAASQLVKSQISNTANHYNATVFTDVSTNRFSTDYIPLVPGKNLIEVEFTFKNTKFSRQLNILNSEISADARVLPLAPAVVPATVPVTAPVTE